MLTTTTRRVLLLLLGLLLATLPGWALAPSASAHSQLLSISPADGATVPSAPAEIVLTFNEEVNKDFVKVLVSDAEGVALTLEDPKVSGGVVTQPLPTSLRAGGYKVTYRVVSKDSHPIAGSSHFEIAGDPQAAPSGTASAAAPTTTSPAPSASMASPDPNPSPSASMASPDPRPSTGTTTTDSGTGIPAWVWLALIGVVVLGVAAALAARGRRRE